MLFKMHVTSHNELSKSRCHQGCELLVLANRAITQLRAWLAGQHRHSPAVQRSRRTCLGGCDGCGGQGRQGRRLSPHALLVKGRQRLVIAGNGPGGQRLGG